ncbi:MAG: hypothetical protein ACRDVE_18075 [Actinocrinis sp.]
MTSIDAPAVPGQAHPHQDLINGLLQLAGWLTDHPELPIGKYDMANLRMVVPGHDSLSDSQRIAHVREVARILDVEPEWQNGNAHFVANRRFGAKIEVEVYAILQSAREQWRRDQELIEQMRAAERAVAETVLLPIVDLGAIEGQADGDLDAMPEVECADCQGTGRQRDGSPCSDCLGKGRIAAPDPVEILGETSGMPPADDRCLACEGRGSYLFNLLCMVCEGTGSRTFAHTGGTW